MTAPFEYRVKSRLPDGAMESRWKRLATDEDYSLLLTGPTRVYKPDGKLLLHYIPAAFTAERMDDFWDTLYALRKYETGNRSYAAGTEAKPAFAGSTRMRTVPVSSAIIGAYDAAPPKQYCRLTAFVKKDFDKYNSLFPLFEEIGQLFGDSVGDRHAAQMAYISRTKPDWVIPGTPFTTITVNVSYPTGYHTDQGDLDEGFSCLTVLRRGDFHGGRLVFPQYRIAADMQNGDQLFMDAHAAHGNTQLYCGDCSYPMGPGAPTPKERPDERAGWVWGESDQFFHWDHERQRCEATRISVVSYYRTAMELCGSADEEAIKADAWAERRASLAEERAMQGSLVEQMATEAVPN